MLGLSLSYDYETATSSNRNKIRIKSLKLFLLLALFNIKVFLVYFILSQSFISYPKTKQKLYKNATYIPSSSCFLVTKEGGAICPAFLKLA